MTLLYTHPACLKHDTGPGHPERGARLEAVLAALDAAPFAALERREAPSATLDAIARVHARGYVEATLAAIPAEGLGALDPDTIVSPGSGAAALRAAGAACAAVDAVITGAAANAFCAVRPPGHHAEPSRAMGFCLFNSVAVAAAHARAQHGLERVAVVDFDVHHGNGVQAMFENDASLFYGSTHQYPFYPGSGAAEDIGCGNIVNAPLPAGAGSRDFRAAYERRVLPGLRAFAPDLVIVCAGFDAHKDDPLAALELTTEDFRWVTQRLLDVADLCCGGRLVSALEGGYNLRALAESAAAHVRALMTAGETPGDRRG